MSSFAIRGIEPSDRHAVAELICVSTNFWYQTHGHPAIFPTEASAADIINVYDALDPGLAFVAEDSSTGRLIGSCFYHPRETHMSLGIMNVHPNHGSRGVARRILQRILQLAAKECKPVRLVSSAMNLDSFSLYTRQGFVPRQVYQDMILAVPPEGLDPALVSSLVPQGLSSLIRPASSDDVRAMGEVEFSVTGIRRDKDYRFFIANPLNHYRVLVLPSASGGLDGFLASVHIPGGINMIGPGAARTVEAAMALLLAQLNHFRRGQPLVLIQADAPKLRDALYRLGGRNCELHFTQVLGSFTPFNGINFPSFLPESG